MWAGATSSAIEIASASSIEMRRSPLSHLPTVV
jgi:hypothetical protein